MNASPARFARVCIALVLALVALAAPLGSANAQYFGRNKVQYRTFGFEVMKTEHFDVYYYPEEEAAARDAARMAERWYARLSRILDYELSERQPVILYGSHPEFQQTNVLTGEIGEGTGGVTEAFKQRVVMPFGSSYAETDHVLGHELVHAFQYDISGLGRAGGGLEAAAQRFQAPLWFIEGMAEYLAIGPVDAHTAMWMRDAALAGEIPSIDRMTRDPRVFPYRWGQAFWAYVGGRWGDAVIGQILKQVGQGVPYPDAFERILNVPLDDIGEEWQTAIRRAYLPLLADRKEPREIARPLITRRKEGGQVNLAPALSPDGTRIVFISERNGLDYELYLADANTGEVLRRLRRGTAFDPHFGSLRFINSAGTWSPDGQRFAFSALRGGRDVIATIDASRGRILREYRIDDVGEITSPTWSPDGRTIVFSGLKGGITDLWSLDVQTGQARQLTDDRYADMQPAFSPDGRTIAFVTDRGTGTDLDSLSWGGYRIALLDVASGEVTLAPAMQEPVARTGSEHFAQKNINPAWTRDGSALYFISNRSGIANIYRVTLATGELTRVTNVFTGVSGITDLSPAISTSRGADKLVFAAFERNGYNIYEITDPAPLAGTPVPAAPLALADTVGALAPAESGVPAAALLPPVPRPSELAFNRVAELIANTQIGLPSEAAAEAFATVPYRPKLTLDYLGQPQVGVSLGGGAFGRSGLYGAVTGIFSDMLGRHTLYAAVMAQGQLDEIGFSTVYLNQRSRWVRGIGAQRVPQIYPLYAQGCDATQCVQQIQRFRIFDTALFGIAQYPFSQVQRIEFSAGARRLGQDVQIFERVIDRATGAFADRERKVSGESFNLVEGSAALVYDNALFGYTSPFAGQRYRFEVTPTFGSLQYVQALADYRKYFFLRPFTLAGRGMHFGRYGSESRTDVFGRGTYLGYPSLVRGYYGVYDDCRNGGNPNTCALLDQLFGSRIGVFNAELRFPLIRALVLGTGNIGFPPIEGFFFADAGVAWGRNSQGLETSPVFGRGIQENPLERGFLTSAGVGMRANLFGYLILEIDYVNAFERLDANGNKRGWHWEFAIQPGF
jgi:Tol biopolymer transport system component